MSKIGRYALGGLTAALVAAVALAGVVLRRGPELAPQRRQEACRPPAQAPQPSPTREFPARLEAGLLISRKELEERLRDLAAFATAGDARSYSTLFESLVETHGERLIPLLEEILAEKAHEPIGPHGAELLSAVVRSQDAPVVARLLAVVAADPVAEVLFGIAIRIGGDASVEPARAILFDARRSESVRRAATQYLGVAATRAAIEALASVLAADELEPLHGEAARALAHTARPEAARRLLAEWVQRFEPTPQSALRNRFLLRALGSMGTEIAGAIVREFVLTQSDPSAKNMVLSIAPMLGAEFALDLAREVLARPGEHYRVREQAIQVVGALATPEAQRFLVEILTRRRELTDVVAAANELVADRELLVPFEEVRRAYAAHPADLTQVVLAILMGRDLPSLKKERGLFEELWAKVAGWLASPDPIVRFFAATAYAVLSAGTERPAQAIAAIFDALPPEAVSMVPAVAERIGDLPAEEGRPLWERIASNPAYASHVRAFALRGFLRAGDFDAAWRAVRSEPDGGARVTMAGMIVAQQGSEGLQEYRQLSEEEKDPETRQVMQQQVQAWDAAFEGQQRAEEEGRGS